MKINDLASEMKYDNDDSNEDGTIDELMEISEFADAVKHNYLTDDDGYGHFATEKETSNVIVLPSKFFAMERPYWATHVNWYNK